MKECIDIYRNRLPDDFEKMLNNLMRLRKLQHLD